MSKAGMILFAKRPQLGGLTLYPMSGGRVAILEEKGNPLVGGGDDHEEEEREITRFELFEAFFVVASDQDELVEAMGLDEEGWKKAVNRFSLGEAGNLTEAFGRLVRSEFERIKKAIAEPKKKVAKKQARK